jgi:hypothetical protein
VVYRASESTTIGLIIPQSATRIVTTFDICRFQGVTALAISSYNLVETMGFCHSYFTNSVL